MASPLFELEGIGKSFPGVRALEGVDLEIRAGEIHAVVGENGAGKSTLMNILSGVYSPDRGSLRMRGEPTRFKDTRDAQEHGVAMIHQELSLAPHLRVAENIFIGRLPRAALGFVSAARLRAEAQAILARLKVSTFGTETRVGELSTSQMQLVEIGKALSLRASVLVMDEPTSSLTASETSMLLGLMRSLALDGVAILFVSHRLDEVFEVAHRITVLRDGRLIATLPRSEAGRDRVVACMVGREFAKAFQRTHPVFRAEETPALEVRGLESGAQVRGVSFSVRRGEILALTGLVGAGRTETVETIFGARPQQGGEVLIDGRPVRLRHPADGVAHGLGLVPEGRKIQGIFPGRSVKENMTITRLGQLCRFGFVDAARETRAAEEWARRLRVKTPSLLQGMRLLSGGNQQKAIFGRWLLNASRILFLDEPTHGVDVGAKEEIYRIVDELAGRGAAVVLISSELPEVLTLADRIVVMREGRVVSEMDHRSATQEGIMHAALGGRTADEPQASATHPTRPS
jgi:ABC-type sugar transport system ATPase subunit